MIPTRLISAATAVLIPAWVALGCAVVPEAAPSAESSRADTGDRLGGPYRLVLLPDDPDEHPFVLVDELHQRPNSESPLVAEGEVGGNAQALAVLLAIPIGKAVWWIGGVAVVGVIALVAADQLDTGHSRDGAEIITAPAPCAQLEGPTPEIEVTPSALNQVALMHRSGGIEATHPLGRCVVDMMESNGWLDSARFLAAANPAYDEGGNHRYVVWFKDDIEPYQESNRIGYDYQLEPYEIDYEPVLIREGAKAMVATMAPEVARSLVDDSRVLMVQEDAVGPSTSAAWTPSPPEDLLESEWRDRVAAAAIAAGVTAKSQDRTCSLPWHLDRLDQHDLPLDCEFAVSSTAGTGVRVYVIDSGVDPGPEFRHVDADPGLYAPPQGREDYGGHGTAVAAMAVGATLGVARGATLVPVRAGPKSTNTLVGMVLAYKWIAKSAYGPSVINASHELTSPFKFVLDIATKKNAFSAGADILLAGLVTKGNTVVIAAGNESQFFAGMGLPALAGAITASASALLDGQDVVPPWAASGPFVSLYAPGADLLVPKLGFGGLFDLDVESGSSFSAGLVSGVAAVHLGEKRSATSRQVRRHLVSESTKGALGGFVLGPNRLLYVAPR